MKQSGLPLMIWQDCLANPVLLLMNIFYLNIYAEGEFEEETSKRTIGNSDFALTIKFQE